jgi:hypothetical protein
MRDSGVGDGARFRVRGSRNSVDSAAVRGVANLSHAKLADIEAADPCFANSTL